MFNKLESQPTTPEFEVNNIDQENSYKDYEPYLAYTRNTNEKEKLHNYIEEEFQDDNFPIKKEDARRNILDLGCGNGINTAFLAKIFSEHFIDAIDRSESQLKFAKKNNSAGNINYIASRLEDFNPEKKYDFILASHVLQYINTDLDEFIKKSVSLLREKGEIWFVQQTKEGMAEIINHQKSYLENPRFENWKTYEDHKKEIEKILKEDKKYKISEGFLDSSFKDINFANPSEEDKKRLEFIFCLEKPFDEQSDEFREHLAKLQLDVKNKRISHPNKILKIKKLKDVSEKKVQLFHPPEDKGYSGEAEVKKLRALPIGLEIIAKSIEKENPEAIVEIFDGNIESLENLLEKISAGIVGVSDWYSKHDNALKILEEAKRKGSVTVIGGPNAAHSAERILKNHQFVDYVVAGDGEEAMAKLVADEKPEMIPNLYWRTKDGDIQFSFSKQAEMDKKYDLRHLDKETIKIYKKENNPFLLSSIRGCVKAASGKRCIFCSLREKGVRTMDTNLVWEQIRELNNKYGTNYYFETGDSFFVKDFPEMLLANRPEDLKDIEFRIYASPEQLTEENVEILKKLNVKKVFVGIETADEELLKKLGKHYKKRHIIKAVELLNKADIEMQCPFMYGIPGETQETMEETYQFAKELIEKYPNIKDILSGHLIPLIGTEMFEKIKNNEAIKKEYKGDLEEDDELDYEQLVELQTKYLTQVSKEEINEYINKTRKLIEGRGSVGAFGVVKK